MSCAPHSPVQGSEEYSAWQGGSASTSWQQHGQAAGSSAASMHGAARAQGHTPQTEQPASSSPLASQAVGSGQVTSQQSLLCSFPGAFLLLVRLSEHSTWRCVDTSLPACLPWPKHMACKLNVAIHQPRLRLPPCTVPSLQEDGVASDVGAGLGTSTPQQPVQPIAPPVPQPASSALMDIAAFGQVHVILTHHSCADASSKFADFGSQLIHPNPDSYSLCALGVFIL
jgi:hypothetical protein